jgi:accessory gene regulator protein AgrB
MDKLELIYKREYRQRTKSPLVIVAMILASIIVITFATSISIESALQKIDLMGINHALGDKDNSQGKQVKILPCDSDHPCPTLIE